MITSPRLLLVALVVGLAMATVPPGQAFANYAIEAPSYIETSTLADGSIRVTWTHEHADEQGYIVYRRLQNEQSVVEVARLHSPLSSPAEYVDRTATGPDSAYSYRICAYRDLALVCSEPPESRYLLP